MGYVSPETLHCCYSSTFELYSYSWHAPGGLGFTLVVVNELTSASVCAVILPGHTRLLFTILFTFVCV